MRQGNLYKWSILLTIWQKLNHFLGDKRQYLEAVLGGRWITGERRERFGLLIIFAQNFGTKSDSTSKKARHKGFSYII